VTAQELETAAQSQIILTGRMDATVAVKMRGRWRKSNKRRGWPGGPVGTIVSEEHGGYIVVLFKADEILNALATCPRAPEGGEV
jgi:hypothetical protein